MHRAAPATVVDTVGFYIVVMTQIHRQPLHCVIEIAPKAYTLTMVGGHVLSKFSVHVVYTEQIISKGSVCCGRDSDMGKPALLVHGLYSLMTEYCTSILEFLIGKQRIWVWIFRARD